MRFRFIVSIFFVFLSQFVWSEWIETSHLQVLNEWKSLDPQTLIVFDIDDVIVCTEDQFAHPYGYLKFVQLTEEAMNQANPAEQEEILRKASLSQLLSKRHIIEEGIADFIQKLKEEGFIVIALTNFPRGSYGAIPRTETWRIEFLKALGVTFTHFHSFPESYEFTELQKGAHLPPLYEEGILFSYGTTKGKVLKAFLEKAKLRPSQIVFIDDMAHHHKSVIEEIGSMQIPLLNIHYLGAHRFYRDFDEELLTHQFNHLQQHEQWLTDKEILSKLNSGNSL